MAKLVSLKPHQSAWLAAHPHRSEAWLRSMMADGFDIHHADGDHSNDDPFNLVLIEATDHKKLHGGNRKRLAKAKASALSATGERLAVGKRVYECKTEATSWKAAGIAAGMSLDRYSSPVTAKRLADAYAVSAGLPLHVHKPAKGRALFHRLEPWS